MVIGVRFPVVEPFYVENPCPQCGHIEASYTFHAAACPEVGAEGEHIHRQCPSCGHEWSEAPRPLRITGYTDS